MRALSFVAISTTGLDPWRHNLLEVALVKVHPRSLRELDAFETKVRPSRIDQADPTALAITGYTAFAWRKAVDIQTALAELSRRLDDTIVAGHNVRFDVGFIEAGFRRARVLPPQTDHHLLDTASLAWPLLARGEIDALTLDALCRRFDLEREEPHRAMSDTRCALAVARRLLLPTLEGRRRMVA